MEHCSWGLPGIKWGVCAVPVSSSSSSALSARLCRHAPASSFLCISFILLVLPLLVSSPMTLTFAWHLFTRACTRARARQVPCGPGWHTLTWTIKDAEFVDKWGYVVVIPSLPREQTVGSAALPVAAVTSLLQCRQSYCTCMSCLLPMTAPAPRSCTA